MLLNYAVLPSVRSIQVVGDSCTTCRRLVIESSTTHSTLSVTYDDLTLESNRRFGVFFDRGDSRVKSRVESPVNRVVSRPATCHNVIAGRRRTRFLNVLKTGFPAAPATLHGHAINCVPVHRFRMGRTPETGLTPAEWREFPRYALARILMHAVKTEPARFWRVFGWFVVCFAGFPSETP